VCPCIIKGCTNELQENGVFSTGGVRIHDILCVADDEVVHEEFAGFLDTALELLRIASNNLKTNSKCLKTNFKVFET
jgi:hypothetical protein